jgi:hypothetical protein
MFVISILACNDCKKSCKYDKNSIKKINQKQINEELHRHGHKKSLLIEGKMRLTEQGRKELLSHYEKYHNFES